MAYLCCGEGEFPITRYCEIVRQRLQKPEYASLHSDARNSNKVDNTEVLLKRFLDNLHIEKCHDIEDVLYTVVSSMWCFLYAKCTSQIIDVKIVSSSLHGFLLCKITQISS